MQASSRDVPGPQSARVWFKALIVAPTVIGSLLALIAISAVPLRNKSKRAKAHSAHDSSINRWRPNSLESLRDAIVGNGKNEITSIFGPPKTAASGLAETWYYPLRPNERLTMAISFDNGLARRVEFFHSPA